MILPLIAIPKTSHDSQKSPTKPSWSLNLSLPAIIYHHSGKSLTIRSTLFIPCINSHSRLPKDQCLLLHGIRLSAELIMTWILHTLFAQSIRSNTPIESSHWKRSSLEHLQHTNELLKIDIFFFSMNYFSLDLNHKIRIFLHALQYFRVNNYIENSLLGHFSVPTNNNFCIKVWYR